jgi:hypothetical protein
MQQPPNEEQLVIDELVGFWQTSSEPRDLTAHIRGTWKPGCASVTSFFAKVRDDLRTDKHSEYAASSAFEFRQFLEAEYRRLYQPYAERQAEAQAKAEAERQAQMKAAAERQAQWKAAAERQAEAQAKAEAEREENERRARAVFDAIGKEMAKATTRAELVELGRKRAYLAPYIGIPYPYGDYENHCWNCERRVSSAIQARCPVCRWYICSSCDSCDHFCNKTYNPVQDEAVDPFLPDYPDDIS